MNMRKCKHCEVEFDISEKPKGWLGNHVNWCDENPKRKENVDKLVKARGSKKNFNNQYSYGAVCSDETREKIRKSSTGRTHSEETKQLMREKALSSSHRRLRRNMIEYNGVMLDSSWELELAKRLDELGIMWIRPDPIPWVDDVGVFHNYFADFYLPAYNLYLDPKNPHAIKVQKKKLDLLLDQYENIIIIDSLDKCKEFIPCVQV